MHFIYEITWVEVFLYNLLQFFQKFKFPEFLLIECVFDRLKIPWFLFIDLCLTQLVFDRCSIDRNWNIFSFYVFDQTFFHASFMFRIHLHCIVFCIHLVVLQSYLSLFSHIICIHFTKLGTQLDLKIDWLIFEFYTVYAIFMCELHKMFF